MNFAALVILGVLLACLAGIAAALIGWRRDAHWRQMAGNACIGTFLVAVVYLTVAACRNLFFVADGMDPTVLLMVLAAVFLALLLVNRRKYR